MPDSDIIPCGCALLCLSCRRTAVEVFDSNCFCSNQQQPLGDSVMRIQLLNACGWQVRQSLVGGMEGGMGAGSSQFVAESLTKSVRKLGRWQRVPWVQHGCHNDKNCIAEVPPFLGQLDPGAMPPSWPVPQHYGGQECCFIHSTRQASCLQAPAAVDMLQHLCSVLA